MHAQLLSQQKPFIHPMNHSMRNPTSAQLSSNITRWERFEKGD